MNEQEKIDAYVLNRLSTTERIEFEKRLTENSDLNDLCVFTQIVKTEIKDRNAKINLIREFENKEKRNRTRNIKYLSSVISGIAAAFLVLLYLHYPSKHISTPVLNLDYYEEYRSNGDIKEIARLINGKQYEKAAAKIRIAETELNETVLTDSISFSSLSIEEKGRIEYEKKACEVDKRELEWLKIHVLLGMGEKDEALSIIQKVMSEEGLHQKEAENLYKNIK